MVDTKLRRFSALRFELLWGQISQSQMQADPIIKPGNVGEDIQARLGLGSVILKVDPLTFEGGEKAFHDRIVVTVSPPAHAYRDVLSIQEVADLLTGILTAPV